MSDCVGFPRHGDVCMVAFFDGHVEGFPNATAKLSENPSTNDGRDQGIDVAYVAHLVTNDAKMGF